MFCLATYLPTGTLSNEDLQQEFPDWNPAKVAKKLGIETRHIARADETALDLATHAAEKLFSQYPDLPSHVDYLLFCTQSPDYMLPTGACILQHRLGLSNGIGAFDYNLGCSGFVYGLGVAKGLLLGKIAKGVLLLTAETYSHYLYPKDRGNRSIFGDGAAALFLDEDLCSGMGVFIHGTDGRGAENLIVRNGGARHCVDPAAEEKNAGANSRYTDNYLYMNGPEIFNFTIEAVPVLVQKTLAANQLTLNDIDYVILHQANSFMLNYLRTVLGIPEEKYYINLRNTGNTVSSSLPIALEDAFQQGLVQAGNRVLLAGFGVGYSYAATVLTI